MLPLELTRHTGRSMFIPKQLKLLIYKPTASGSAFNLERIQLVLYLQWDAVTLTRQITHVSRGDGQHSLHRVMTKNKWVGVVYFAAVMTHWRWLSENFCVLFTYKTQTKTKPFLSQGTFTYFWCIHNLYTRGPGLTRGGVKMLTISLWTESTEQQQRYYVRMQKHPFDINY